MLWTLSFTVLPRVRAVAFRRGRIRASHLRFHLLVATARVRYVIAIFAARFVIIVGVIARIGQLGIEWTLQVVVIRDLRSTYFPNPRDPSQDGDEVNHRHQEVGRIASVHIVRFVMELQPTQYTHIYVNIYYAMYTGNPGGGVHSNCQWGSEGRPRENRDPTHVYIKKKKKRSS